MTVKELIELLQKQPQDKVVYLSTNCCGCFKPVTKVSDSKECVIVEDEY